MNEDGRIDDGWQSTKWTKISRMDIFGWDSGIMVQIYAVLGLLSKIQELVGGHKQR